MCEFPFFECPFLFPFPFSDELDEDELDEEDDDELLLLLELVEKNI